MEIGSRIQSQVQSEMGKTQREYILRQQLKAIQEELGEADDEQAEIDELRRAHRGASLPERGPQAGRARAAALERMPPQAAEYGVIRTYLEWIARPAVDQVDRGQPRPATQRAQVLDEDHYDLEKVKERILEYLAVRKLKPDARARSSASSARRASARRRWASRSRARSAASSCASRSAACATRPRSAATGAPTSARCPAASSRALRDAGNRNPVFMIDEVDKMGADFRGDPSSALLEVLDPEQNHTSATTTSTCRSTSRRSCSSPRRTCSTRSRRPLRDRMEIIELSGYTDEEKLQIAQALPDPAQIEATACAPSRSRSPTRRLDVVIDEYTREAGVRNLEREIGTICRKVAREVAEGEARR